MSDTELRLPEPPDFVSGERCAIPSFFQKVEGCLSFQNFQLPHFSFCERRRDSLVLRMGSVI